MASSFIKIESDVEHIKSVIDDIKLNMRQMQSQIIAARDSIVALQSEVSAIKATIPHLATQEDLCKLKWSLNTHQSSGL